MMVMQTYATIRIQQRQGVLIEKMASKQSRVTGKDVAQLAGVSQSTVSRVLNPKGDTMISEETAERVREVAQQLGYSPNPLARALRGDNTNLIGLAVREIGDPFFASLIEILNEQAKEQDYNVVLGHADSDPRETLKLTRILDMRHVDGLLFIGDSRNDEQVLQVVERDNLHAIALCRGRRASSIPIVNCDNEAGMRLLMDYLYDLGHRQMMFIDGGWAGDSRERRIAFLNYQNQEELSLNWIQSVVNDANGGYQIMQEILKMVPRPTAVLAADDMMAIGALKAAHDAGLRVPEDISITGFDDITLGQFTHPALTTVRQPIDLMSSKAIQLLMDLIEGHVIPEEEMLVEIMPELMIRESAGPPPTP